MNKKFVNDDKLLLSDFKSAIRRNFVNGEKVIFTIAINSKFDKVKGIIHISDIGNKVYLCHNEYLWAGNRSPELYGNKYSYELDFSVKCVEKDITTNFIINDDGSYKEELIEV